MGEMVQVNSKLTRLESRLTDIQRKSGHVPARQPTGVQQKTIQDDVRAVRGISSGGTAAKRNQLILGGGAVVDHYKGGVAHYRILRPADVWKPNTSYAADELIQHVPTRVLGPNIIVSKDERLIQGSFGTEWAPGTAYAINQDIFRVDRPANWQPFTYYQEGTLVLAEFYPELWKRKTLYQSGDYVTNERPVTAWQADTGYVTGQYVRHQNNIYKAPSSFTSGDPDFIPGNWTLVETFVVWQPNTDYTAGDYRRYQNRTYQANSSFTSGTAFNASNWTLLPLVDRTEVYQANGDRSVMTYFDVDDFTVVANPYAGKPMVYEALRSFSSGSFFRPHLWAPKNYVYILSFYRAALAHTSGTKFDPELWNRRAEPSQFRATAGHVQPAQSIDYSDLELLNHPTELYAATTAHTSGTTFNAANWDALDVDGDSLVTVNSEPIYRTEYMGKAADPEAGQYVETQFDRARQYTCE